MKLKPAGTPLDRLTTIDDAARAALKNIYITSVEDLVGAMHSSPEQIADLLRLDEPSLVELRTAAEDALGESSRRAIAKQVGRTYYVSGLSAASRLAKRSSR